MRDIQETKDTRHKIRDNRYETKVSVNYSLILSSYHSIIYIFILSISILLSSCQSDEKIKHEQYYIAGKDLYEKNCANCHQKDGKGFQNLYPPIANSEFLNNKVQVMCIIKHGLHGEIMVNNKKYDQAMPANPGLYALDIAQIITYMDKEFQDKEVITETTAVEKALANCK